MDSAVLTAGFCLLDDDKGWAEAVSRKVSVEAAKRSELRGPMPDA